MQTYKKIYLLNTADFLFRNLNWEKQKGWKTSCLAQHNLTCNVSIVFLQLVSLHPLVPTLLVDVHFMVIRANGNLFKEEIKQSSCTGGFLLANAIFGKASHLKPLFLNLRALHGLCKQRAKIPGKSPIIMDRESWNGLDWKEL